MAHVSPVSGRSEEQDALTQCALFSTGWAVCATACRIPVSVTDCCYAARNSSIHIYETLRDLVWEGQMAEHAEPFGTVVIGAGQAGLATSYELARRGLDHVVLERGRIGEAWRGRWDSLCMILPNWFNCLPGFPYQGSEPDGFQTRDEWVADLVRYAAAFAAPVREGVAVDGGRRAAGRTVLRCRRRPARSSRTNVVVATGALSDAARAGARCGAGRRRRARSIPVAYRNPARSRQAPSSSSARATPAARLPRSSPAPGGRSTSPSGTAGSRSAGIGAGTCNGGTLTHIDQFRRRGRDPAWTRQHHRM